MKLPSDSEIQPLIRLPGPPPRQDTQSLWFPKRFLCLPSKGAVLILFWTLIVGMIYKLITAGSIIAARSAYLTLNQSDHDDSSRWGALFEVNTFFIIRIIFALASFLYPLSGFIADTFIGRYRMVLYSLLFLLCGCISFSVGSILYFSHIITAQQATVVHGLKEFVAILLLGFLLTFIGFSGYQSNYIQLGLDQLQDAPSYSLGLFVHAVEWFLTIGLTLLQLIISWCTCSYDQYVIRFLISLPFLFILVLLIFIFVGWWKQQWFHSEPVRHNPYKTVFQVIKFAWRHKYPVQYSAFSESDDKEPSRLDYAKEVYGGPFTTEQVEDVRTFLKIIVVLLSLGPVFTLTAPAGLFYAKFVEHVTSPDKMNNSCNWKWIALDTGGLKYLVATVFFPIYIWLLYSALRNCIPRIFTRLWIWILILVICVGSMVVIDLVGHFLYHHRNHVGAACMITNKVTVMVYGDKASTLQLHWGVVILPTILQLVAPIMITTTTFEFITAQSPYSMKGFLVGVFFAIMGFFRFIGSLALLPFYLPHFWSAKENSIPIVNCGFGYLFSICTIGTIGFILFSLVSKWYQYRERG